jgi:hypothetical protein
MPAETEAPPVEPTPTETPAPEQTPAAGGEAAEALKPAEPTPEETPPGEEDDGLDAVFEGLDEATVPKPAADPIPPDEPSPVETEAPEPKVELPPLTEAEAAKLPKDFRKRLDIVNTELAQTKKRETELKEELENFRKSQGGDAEAITKEIEQRNAELKELRGEIRKMRFEKSDDYIEKYEKPWHEAAESAREDIEKLKVIVPDPEGGESTTRQAKWDDFVKLYGMEPADQDEAVETMFGRSAYRVSAYLAGLKGRDREMTAALNKEKENWEANAASERAQSVTRMKQINELWDKTNADLVAKKPEWYAPKEDDKEGNDLLAKGYETFKDYWANRGKMKPEDVLVYEAQLHNRAAAMPRMAHQNGLLQQKVQELEAKIQKMLGKGPGGDLRGQEGGETVDKTDAETDRILAEAFKNAQ